MTYRLIARLCEDTEYYDHEETVKYVDYLEEQGRLLKIDNLIFDAEAMETPFACDSRCCVPDADGRILGKKRKTSSCCVVYTPRLSPKERDRIEEILPDLYRRFPELQGAILNAEGYYEWDEGYDRLVTKRPNGMCVFMTPDESELGFHGCLIHAWCLEHGKDPHYYKPSACVMFPLFLLDVEDGSDEEKVLVTFHSREVMTLGEDEDNFTKVGCMKRNPFAEEPVYVAMKETLVYMFGEEAWNRLDEAMRARRAEAEQEPEA